MKNSYERSHELENNTNGFAITSYTFFDGGGSRSEIYLTDDEGDYESQQDAVDTKHKLAPHVVGF